jgi:tetratricopeptide (TPR) repeat protein
LSWNDPEKAIEYYQQSLEMAREIRHRCEEGRALSNLGKAYLTISKYDKVIECCQQSLDIAQERGDYLQVLLDIEKLAKTFLEIGDYTKAVDYSKSWLAIVRKIGDAQQEEVALGILDQALEGRVLSS